MNPIPTDSTGHISSHKPPRAESWRSALSTIAILLLAPLIALGLITFVFQSYLVDGPSMEKTLYNQDRLIVWKLPRTWARLTHHTYIPKRGDIVVFTEPGLSRFGHDPKKQIIKRVVGLPNERVVVKNDVVTVFNKNHPSGFRPDTALGYQHNALDTSGSLDITLPAGYIYVMGDNRTNSLDSRSFGPVNARNIVGKLVLKVLPVRDMTRF